MSQAKKSAYARSREIIEQLQAEKRVRGIHGLALYIVDCWEDHEVEEFLAAVKKPGARIVVQVDVVDGSLPSSSAPLAHPHP